MYLDKLSKEQFCQLENYLSKKVFENEKIRIDKTLFDTFEIYIGSRSLFDVNDFEIEPAYLNVIKAYHTKMASFFGEKYVIGAKKYYTEQEHELTKSLHIQLRKNDLDPEYVQKINERLILNGKIRANLHNLLEKTL